MIMLFIVTSRVARAFARLDYLCYILPSHFKILDKRLPISVYKFNTLGVYNLM